MNFEKLLYWLLVLISVSTLISGLVQIFAPGFILGLIGAEITPATRQCFGTIGMFMALFGGLLLHGLITRQMLTPVFFWAGLQKIGAFVAVAIGVANHVFSPMAMLVAGFDLLSCILVFVYLRVAAKANTAPLTAVERSLP